MYFSTPVQAISTVSTLLVGGYAIWRGARAERLAGALLMLDCLTTPLLQGHNAFHHTEFAIFAIDGLLALVLTGLALVTNRFWPLWAAAFQFLELVMHVAMLVDHGVRPIAYFIGMEISSYLILAALAVGTWLEGPYSNPRTP
jgi:hypothetical protein